MGKSAIVIGATGLVGSVLTNQLAEAAHISRVLTLTRRPWVHGSAKVQNHVVDFEHLEDHVDLFKADLLFSCLGTTRKQAGSIAAQRKVDLDYQYRAAKLAVDKGVKHYMLVSSSGADTNSGSPYLKMKGELEDQVMTLPFQQISILQPSLLLGHRQDSRIGETLGSLILPGLCRLPGLRRFRPISGEQVAARMVLLSRQAGPTLQRFCLDEIFIE